MPIRKDSRISNETAKPGNKRMVDTRKKRTKEQREADLGLITKLLLRENMSRSEISNEIAKERPYTISAIQVDYDVKELLSRWRDAYLDDIDVLKGRELQRIDQLESAYWDSYERSLKGINTYKEDMTESGVDMLGIDDSSEEKKRVKRFVSRKFQDERDGESRFLNGIQWCINKRCEILGLNAPLKSELTFDWRSEAEKQGIDPGIVFNELVKKFVDANIIDGDVKEIDASVS
jgi:hypothetical protein